MPGLDALADNWWRSLPQSDRNGLRPGRILEQVVDEGLRSLAGVGIRVGRRESPAPGLQPIVDRHFSAAAARTLLRERRYLDMRAAWDSAIGELTRLHPERADDIRRLAAPWANDHLHPRRKNELSVAENVDRTLLGFRRFLFAPPEWEKLVHGARVADRSQSSVPRVLAAVVAMGADPDDVELLEWSTADLAAVGRRIVADDPHRDPADVARMLAFLAGEPFGIRDPAHRVAMLQALLLCGARRSAASLRAALDIPDSAATPFEAAVVRARLVHSSEPNRPHRRSPGCFDLIRATSAVVVETGNTSAGAHGWPSGTLRPCLIGDDEPEELLAAVGVDAGRRWWHPDWSPVGTTALERATRDARHSELDAEVAADRRLRSLLRDFRRTLLRAAVLGGGDATVRRSFPDLLAVQGFLGQEVRRNPPAPDPTSAWVPEASSAATEDRRADDAWSPEPGFAHVPALSLNRPWPEVVREVLAPMVRATLLTTDVSPADRPAAELKVFVDEVLAGRVEPDPTSDDAGPAQVIDTVQRWARTSGRAAHAADLGRYVDGLLEEYRRRGLELAWPDVLLRWGPTLIRRAQGAARDRTLEDALQFVAWLDDQPDCGVTLIEGVRAWLADLRPDITEQTHPKTRERHAKRATDLARRFAHLFGRRDRPDGRRSG